AFGEYVDAFDGIHRRALGDLGGRAAVSVARMDSPAVLAGGVNDLLPALAEEALDDLHLGVRRPENPNSVRHDFLRLVLRRKRLRITPSVPFPAPSAGIYRPQFGPTPPSWARTAPRYPPSKW